MNTLRLLEALVLPPAGPLLLAVLGGWLLWRGRRRWGASLLAVALSALYLGAIPATHQWLAGLLEREPALAEERLSALAARAEAIVVLAAGRYPHAPEYGGRTTVDRFALERLRYAAHLHRRSGLPLVVSGGDPIDGVSQAAAMAEVLEDAFGVPVRWLEEGSGSTFGNARLTWRLLEPVGVRRIVLVSHAGHMPRARWIFERQGFEVVAAPTVFSRFGAAMSGVHAWLPRDHLVYDINRALHELIGDYWYRRRAGEAV